MNTTMIASGRALIILITALMLGGSLFGAVRERLLPETLAICQKQNYLES